MVVVVLVLQLCEFTSAWCCLFVIFHLNVRISKCVFRARAVQLMYDSYLSHQYGIISIDIAKLSQSTAADLLPLAQS